MQEGSGIMNETVQAYQSVTTSGEIKNLERLNAKTRYDEAQAI